ncbi:MAG: glycosyltransferase family 4 protein [Bacteroidia bacterium]|nr:glycosyltransferase family 4 protein [Bacteroidia bacterium]NNJ56384.1 glycosyltransferase family 4 protein [Bacteroidia bacterium]
MKQKIILATTYAVHPTRGSEDAMGWNYVLQIARFNKVICITRENNQKAIEEFITLNPKPIFDNITFVYFDTPYWMRFWKRGSRGAMIYYWIWQRSLPAFVKKQNLQFDIAHNATFPNDWTPSYLWKLGKPFVWGPIGHHPLIPSQYLEPFSKKYWITDRLTWLVKNAFWKLSIGLKRTAKKADFIYAMNSSVKDKIKLQNGKYCIRPSIATQDFGFDPNYDIENFNVISAGRFVPLKGFDLTILSFARFVKNLPKEAQNNAKLTLVGKGPEEKYLRSIIKKQGIIDKVEFIDWIEREDLMNLMKSSSLFLFPSHEGAGMVVAEALSFALPVVCLDNCGPGELITPKCGIAVKQQTYKNTVLNLSEALLELYNNPKKHWNMRVEARKHFEETFHWNKRGEWLRNIYEQVY